MLEQNYRCLLLRVEFPELSGLHLRHVAIITACLACCVGGLWSTSLMYKLFLQLSDWASFDVFRVRDLSDGWPLTTIATAIIDRFDLTTKLNLDRHKLRSFLKVSPAEQCSAFSLLLILLEITSSTRWRP